MASKISAELLESIVRCGACEQDLVDPRILPCLHTFCLACLRNMECGKQSGEVIPCHICKFEIPDAGLGGIKKNTFVQKLLDLRQLMDECTNMNLPCEACSEDGINEESEEVPPACVYCVECKQRLCESCSRSHKRFTVSRHHHLIQLTDEISFREFLEISDQQFCDLHDRDPVTMYCVDCKSALCGVCLASHAGHDYETFQAIGEKFRDRLESAIVRASNGVDFSREELRRIEEGNPASLQTYDDLRLEVEKHAESLKQLIDSHTRTLLRELEAFKTRELMEISSRRNILVRHVLALEDYISYASDMKKIRGSTAHICRIFHEMTDRAELLEVEHAACLGSVSKTSFSNTQLMFSPSFPGDILGVMENVVGKLHFPDDSTDDYDQIGNDYNLVNHLNGVRRQREKVSNSEGERLELGYPDNSGNSHCFTTTLDSVGYLRSSSADDDPFKMDKCAHVLQFDKTSKFLSDLKKAQEKAEQMERCRRRRHSEIPASTNTSGVLKLKVKSTTMALQVTKDIARCSVQ